MTEPARRPMWVPNATAFLAGFCIMVVELSAGRIVARYIGTSLITWTSVIGVVLGGIALGSYFGGLAADRGTSRKILAWLFFAAAIACSLTPAVNRVVGAWEFLWGLSWPIRVVFHVAAVFLLPALFLGAIGPVVAKLALDQDRRTGWTVGNLYAWSSAGSVVGTFATGFLLIAKLGTAGVFWWVAVVLAGIGAFYSMSAPLGLLSAAFLILLGALSFSTQGWAQTVGGMLKLRQPADPLLVYWQESAYLDIRIRKIPRQPHLRQLILDQLLHSVVDLNAPEAIQGPHHYAYLSVHAAFAKRGAENHPDLQTLVIGGGGYTLPRHLALAYPQGIVDVVEIDPGVTKAAEEALGLGPMKGLHIHHEDARDYVNRLSREAEPRSYDVIYGDALSGLSVPVHLTTIEFHERLSKLLAPGGVYTVTVLDVNEPGLLLGALVHTLKQTFPEVSVFRTGRLGPAEYIRHVFVIAASDQALNQADLDIDETAGSWLEEAQIKAMVSRAGPIVLSDDHAPVEQLLMPLLRQHGRELSAIRLVNQGNVWLEQNALERAEIYYRRAIQEDPALVAAYNNLGNTLTRQDRIDEAIEAYNKAVELAPTFVEAYSNLSAALGREGRIEEAITRLELVVAGQPDSADAYYNLATLLSESERLEESVVGYRKALKLRPDFAEAHLSLGNVLLRQVLLQEAFEEYQEAVRLGNLPQAHNNLGALWERLGRLNKAIASYQAAVEADPDYEKALLENLRRVQVEAAAGSDKTQEPLATNLPIQVE